MSNVRQKNFFDIFFDTPISICESRDPKKLYQKARNRKIYNFTGVQDIYEISYKPDMILNGTDSLEYNSQKLINILYNRNIISFVDIN